MARKAPTHPLVDAVAVYADGGLLTSNPSEIGGTWLEAIERLLSRVTFTDTCWLWNGHTNDKGYGYMSVGGRPQGVHRWSWMFFHKASILPKFKILHTCDTPPCIFPFHLWIGTDKENTQDMMSKGRNKYVAVPVYGEDHGLAKLKAKDIPVIRDRHAAGVPKAHIARDFHVCRATIRKVIEGRTWANV